MIGAKIGEPESMGLAYEDDPTMRVGVNFPFYVGSGTENTAVVYFEPGCGPGSRTDGAEEILSIRGGRAEATVGDESGRVTEGGIAVVPAVEAHALRNAGDETVRVVGFFSSNVVSSVFERPMMAFGEREVGTPPLLAEDEVRAGDARVNGGTQRGARR